MSLAFFDRKRGKAKKSVSPEEQPVDITINTDYGCLQITDTTYGGEPVRMLLVDGVQESATYLEKDLRDDLVFQYTRRIAALFGDYRFSPMKVLLIGGAGFSLPKYFISHYPEGCMDVVELHGEMTEIAKRYFYLDDITEEYDARGKRLSIYRSDGLDFLKRLDKSRPGKYDLIINDAYIGNVLDRGLTSEKGVKLIHSALSENGVYCLNIITAMTGYLSMSGLLEKEIASGYFRNVGLIQSDPAREPSHRQNCLLLASDGELPDI